MNKIISATLLATLFTTPVYAANSSGNIGLNVSFDNAIGIHGEFNLQKPVSLQIFLKNYSHSYRYDGRNDYYNYSYTAIGAAVLYDFSKELKIGIPKLHPYAGLGLYTVTASFNGPGPYVDSRVNGGIYLTVGARYEITPAIDFDGSYNNFGGLTIGANLKF